MQTDQTNYGLDEYCSIAAFKTRKDNPLKPSEFEWLFRNRKSNGFQTAFVQINVRKFLIHVPTFIECLANRRGA
jgi:hypothetical protein